MRKGFSILAVLLACESAERNHLDELQYRWLTVVKMLDSSQQSRCRRAANSLFWRLVARGLVCREDLQAGSFD